MRPSRSAHCRTLHQLRATHATTDSHPNKHRSSHLLHHRVWQHNTVQSLTLQTTITRPPLVATQLISFRPVSFIMALSASLPTLLVVLVLLAAGVSSHPVTLRSGAVSANGWSKSAVASPKDLVHFHLALPQRNLDVLESKFWAVSNPDSEEYGQFLSTEEIQSIVSPTWSERQELIAHLIEQGVDAEAIRDYGDSIEVAAEVEVASQLFDATFHSFKHASGRRVVRASSDVSVSAFVASRIETVYGLTGFPVPHLNTHSRAIGEDPTNDAIIPQSLYAMYGLPRNTTVDNTNSSGVSQGVIEWEGQSFRPIDLLYYASNTSLNGMPVYPDSQIVGNYPKEAGDESTLDVDMIVGVAPGNTNWFWLEDNETTWLYGWSVHFVNATAIPDVISISYGWFEGGQCDDGTMTFHHLQHPQHLPAPC